MNPRVWRLSSCSRFSDRLKGEVEVGERLHGGKSGGAHRRLEPAIVAERDRRAEQLFNRGWCFDGAAVEVMQDLIEGFERPRHLEISELRADALAQRERGGFHGAHSAPASPPASAGSAYTASDRRSTGMCGRATVAIEPTGEPRVRRSGARTSE